MLFVFLSLPFFPCWNSLGSLLRLSTRLTFLCKSCTGETSSEGVLRWKQAAHETRTRVVSHTSAVIRTIEYLISIFPRYFIRTNIKDLVERVSFYKAEYLKIGICSLKYRLFVLISNINSTHTEQDSARGPETPPDCGSLKRRAVHVVRSIASCQASYRFLQLPLYVLFAPRTK